MKFYDKGFIKTYPNHTQVAIFSAGTAVLELKIYTNQICKDTFECLSLKQFNKKHLNSSYDEQFIKNIFENRSKTTIFEDKENKITIKIVKD